MDQLPVEIQENILNHFLWDEINELYRLRVVSKAWKSVIDEFTSTLFQVWYNRCKAEIPEDHLTDIVQAKYPLVAHPWQKYYWVDSRLPHVAKNAYDIWKSWPNFDDGIDHTKVVFNWPIDRRYSSAIGMNDKYYGATVCSGQQGTAIHQWNNPEYLREYDLDSDQIDFYTTDKGPFVVLASYEHEKKISYMSKYPIDSPNLPPKLILLGCGDYCITQNECFYFSEDDFTVESGVVKHKILTDGGFKTSTIIEPPAGMPKLPWNEFRVEIIDSSMYIVKLVGRNFSSEGSTKKEDEKLSVAKYKFCRNSTGKLSFTLEEWKVLDKNERENSALYSQIYNIMFDCNINSGNLCLTDYAFATEKFNSWLKDAFNGDIRAIAVHSNYVICEEQKRRGTQICIFQKDNLIECMKANDRTHLKPALKCHVSFSAKIINWIGIIYNGVKLQMILQFLTTVHDDDNICHISFY